jgi:hypothetical protein
MRENLALARREACQALPERVHLDLRHASAPVHLDGVAHGRQQLPVIDRLGQEIHRAGLHGPHARRDVAPSSDEDDGPRGARGRQRLLQLEPVEPGQGDIEHEAAGCRRVVLLEEGCRRGKRARFEARRDQQARQRS